MYQEFFSNLESATLPLVAMGFFVFAFVLVLLRTFLHKRKSDYEEIAALPLEDGSDSDSDRSEVNS
ncbi:MAG TPA: hypothetical protein VLA66_13345 [Thermoanaerobaculia bacterium]|nr:hypothetical protein [Thermoanaerobaculia bacterium]